MTPAGAQRLWWLAVAFAALLQGCTQNGADPQVPAAARVQQAGMASPEPAVAERAVAEPAGGEPGPIAEPQMRVGAGVDPAVVATIEAFLGTMAPICRVVACRNDPTMAAAACHPEVDGPMLLLDNRSGELLLVSWGEMDPDFKHQRADRSIVPPEEVQRLNARCSG